MGPFRAKDYGVAALCQPNLEVYALSLVHPLDRLLDHVDFWSANRLMLGKQA